MSLLDEFKAELDERNVQYQEMESVESCIAEADVIYMEPVVQADYTVSRDEATEDKGLTPAAYRVTRELLAVEGQERRHHPALAAAHGRAAARRRQHASRPLLGRGVQRRRHADVAARPHPRRDRVGEKAMQTHLRGRDMIDLQEWTKDEIDTLFDVAFALKRDRALNQPHPYLRDKVLAMLFFFSSTRTRASFEAGMAQLGGHAQFIESQTHPDRPRRHGQGDRRDPRSLQRRDRHPPVRLGNGQQVHPRRGRSQPRAGAEHAVRRLPPAPGAGGPA